MSPERRKDQASDSATAYKYRNPFERLTEIRDELIKIFTNPPNEECPAQIQTLAGRLQTVSLEASDAAIATIFIDLQEFYTVQHAIHVAILVDLMSESLGWELNERRSLVCAALTMNVSMGMLQDALAKQASPLTDMQKDLIRAHPRKSVEILKSIGVSDENWLDFVEKHHESADGTGYPGGLSGDQIPYGASLIHLADVYCAKVAGRYYRDPIQSHLAAKQVFLSRDKKFAGSSTEVIIKLLGLYPPGCQVRLANGESAVVIKRGRRVDTPYVKSIMDAQGNRFNAPILRNTGGPLYTVKETIFPNVVKWDPDYMSLWGYNRQ